ncbi:gamma-glutamylcyclotransferase family protein [Bowmanella sp. JS7-9]|uniref:Gamma-glutamylcyclotransferase family protein n=1 Tax=Pseudobowmanella zhangzhouensis TaxID=1537679 RepID=A0ABW1XN58_9ALTE|nr:gamma-glutamylcyclotransferase family protein [Bowmanella sp. JS7-9]TBX20641.1 UDP-N-acetylmuramate--alanine ligase [Bowmanella sp. JS7-9]
MPRLFSYGTLQLPDVQLATFGRLLDGTMDQLPGYIVGELVIRDPQVLQTSGQSVHPILRYTGNPADRVKGTVFEITEAELAQADEYEVDDYQRVHADTVSGQQVWIYIAKTDG